MARRELSETGFYHITTRTAGQIALFEDDHDRRYYLRLLRAAKEKVDARILAWVLMTDHVHLVVDFGENTSAISTFMHFIDARYTRYFNAKTKRTGTLFQGTYWSGSICNDAQLIATIHYVHMNPEAAGLASMRSYRWSSYQEYAGKRWVVDTSFVLELFGSFKQFDSYEGSAKDVIRRTGKAAPQDGDTLNKAMALANVATSAELRSLPKERRNEIIRLLGQAGASRRQIARTFGIGVATVSRILG